MACKRASGILSSIAIAAVVCVGDVMAHLFIERVDPIDWFTSVGRQISVNRKELIGKGVLVFGRVLVL